MGVRICMICMYACMCILFMYIYTHTRVCLLVRLVALVGFVAVVCLPSCMLAGLFVCAVFICGCIRSFFLCVCVCFRCMGYGLIFVVVRLMISGRGHFP